MLRWNAVLGMNENEWFIQSAAGIEYLKKMNPRYPAIHPLLEYYVESRNQRNLQDPLDRIKKNTHHTQVDAECNSILHSQRPLCIPSCRVFVY